MSIKKVNLSTSHGSVQLGLHTPLQEFPAGNGQVLPESVASGGTAFQAHRLMRANVYVADALPTENGYSTVAYLPLGEGDYTKYANSDSLVWYTVCDGRETLLAYGDKDVAGIPYTPDGHVIWKKSGAVENGFMSNVDIKGIHTEQLLTPIGVHGRIVGHNTKFIFWSGVGVFDFTPSLATGAGSSGHIADIGQIVQLIPAEAGFYALGTRGALWAKCTGDIQVPFAYSQIPGFSGVRSDSKVKVRYYTQNPMVLSNSGLCVLTPAEAQYDRVDNYRIMESANRVLEIQPHGAELSGIVDSAEYIDSPDCVVTWLYYEKPCDAKCPVVSNVSPMYTTVSFGWDERAGEFTRLLVINQTLQRESVLHVGHTDVIDAPNGSGAEFTIMSRGKPYNVKFGAGIGALIYHNLTRYLGDVICISKLSLSGRFETGLYNEESLQSIRAQQGHDILDSCVESLDLTRAVQREVQYAGRLRQRYVSLVLKWAGELSGVTLEYA